MHKICVPEGCRIEHAVPADTEELLRLYRSMIGGAAGWSENYPSQETIDFDLSRDSLFVMKNETNEIVATISIDDDPEVATLPCWSETLTPVGELSRLCVRSDMRNLGIARQMMLYAFDVMRARGLKAVHILVRPNHNVALASYTPLGYRKSGECNLFGHNYICMEMPL